VWLDFFFAERFCDSRTNKVFSLITNLERFSTFCMEGKVFTAAFVVAYASEKRLKEVILNASTWTYLREEMRMDG